jgi:hypothetical protein
VPFIGIWKTRRWGCQSRLVRPVHPTGQTGRVTPHWIRTLTEKKTLLDGKFGLGPGHVRRGPDKSDGVQIPTVILFIRHLQKMSLESGKGTEQVWWTGLALDRSHQSDRCAISIG